MFNIFPIDANRYATHCHQAMSLVDLDCLGYG